jgi:hypothetical protein
LFPFEKATVVGIDVRTAAQIQEFSVPVDAHSANSSIGIAFRQAGMTFAINEVGI